MSKESVRVRFAPSPTGFLHIGGVRTALFNWLLARQNGGQFLLRIEDTDLERSEDRFTHDIMTSMKWLGLDWDEEPIFQSKRLSHYQAKADELIAKGVAYRCTCSEADVEKMRVRLQAEGKKPMYDRTCREKNLPAGTAPFVIRLKVPLSGSVTFTDMIRGDITVANEEVDDFVLIRSNGAPTYNLSCVVDDVESRMTHIVRGDDHINNTPKQIHLYNNFGYPQPKFAHLPMILGTDKKKLSKRTSATSTNMYRAEGYLPEALLNFLARLGWSHGDQEIFTLEEMKRYFDFAHVQKAGAVFNVEKLLWLNGAWIRQVPADRLHEIALTDFSSSFKKEAALARARAPLAKKIVPLIQPKVKLTKEIAEQLAPVCEPGVLDVSPTGLKWEKDEALKTNTKKAVAEVIEAFEAKLKSARASSRGGDDRAWGDSPSLEDAGVDPQAVDAILRPIGEKHGVKLGDLAQPIRLVVTGKLVSAGLFELLSWLPSDVILPRLKKVATL